MSRFGVAGKVFFITGGASGIGKAVIKAVLAEQAKVFFIDNNKKDGEKTLEEIRARHGADNVGFSYCDVSDRHDFENAFGQAVNKFGQVDVMFNNAGLVSERRPHLVVNVNLLGVIYGTEIAAAHMRKDKGGKGGRIINVSSLADIKETGIEYATLHPGNVVTKIWDLKEGDMFRLKENREKVLNGNYVMPMSKLVKAFLDLVTMEMMNGAMLEVTNKKIAFVKMEKRELRKMPPSPLKTSLL
ncbi:15-hydroxyprostaglandin dehydrogenase [NAD(+)]-like [Elysia marginata]|uniref:15-hydroxyprostaglandin dehydrogenase [NAD(+)] n=1 Tax=Elysia marginata TaxID=1093978 RepID=A0AAV4H4X7_9GAST|nr:15-hydroxyprostaglandin dehydrogenase [NAD(+)]-like [Elysia marginata]